MRRASASISANQPEIQAVAVSGPDTPDGYRRIPGYVLYDGEKIPELVTLRHRSCGAIALVVAAAVVDNPARKAMARDMMYPHGEEPKAGQPLTCPTCGMVMRFGPPDLCLDHGPDHRQSMGQRLGLYVAQKILTGFKS